MSMFWTECLTGTMCPTFFCKVRGTSMKRLHLMLLEIAEWFKVLWPIVLVLVVIILYGNHCER